ncbi:hypothetical protein THAR02_09972 [Trichoderma harzianum]|uniref:Uncharacterized protein n=1 Tax=Trichoderma harzianum TaxID=5544 RepID=A0A0F9ZXP0_TRIHA|nr:hypothetical protein THAR02_09972 [Trichoderma harzianum]
MTQLSAHEEFRPRNGSSLSREIELLINYVKQLEFDPNTFVIIVCRHGAIEGLTNKINQKKQEKGFQRVKNLDIRATDDIRLSAVIAAVEKSELYDNLVIITSGFINHLYFDIGFRITDLKVYRCATNDNPNEYLHVDGYSKFHGQAVRSWEGMYHEAKLWLGPGVVFNLGSHIGQLGQLSENSSAVSEFDRNKLRAHIEKMDRVKMEGSWWDDFRAPISAIVGILASAGKLASTGFVKMSAEGIFVQYKFIGYAISTAAAASMSALSAGTAMLVAPGVAAAVYFIPWASIFGWLNTVVSWLTTGLNKIWEKIKDWLASCASTIQDTLGLDGKLHGPLRFPA